MVIILETISLLWAATKEKKTLEHSAKFWWDVVTFIKTLAHDTGVLKMHTDLIAVLICYCFN